MATYKLNIVSKLGKYHMALWDAAKAKVEAADNPAHDSLSDLVVTLNREIETRSLVEGTDTVIFRSIAFDDFAQLAREVSMGTY